MATIPNFEKVLLEIHQCFGLTLNYEKDKKKLGRLEKPFSRHIEVLSDVLDEILTACGMDDDLAKDDVISSLYEWGQFNSTLEQSTWTHEADLRQVTWFLAGYVYAPDLGRIVANWSSDIPLDKGMPSGRFWYFPEVRDHGAKLATAELAARHSSALREIKESDVAKMLEAMAENMASLDREALKDMLNGFVNKITLDPATLAGSIHYKIPVQSRNSVASPTRFELVLSP